MTPAEHIERGTARVRLLDASLDVIRAKGLAGTSVDDLCLAAGVSKGAFFHHFDTKEDLAVAAANHWSSTTGEMFAAAAYHQLPTAAERVLAYLDLRDALVVGPTAAFTCLAGTMVQEVYATNPAIRVACGHSILGHAATLEADLDQALADAGSPAGVTAAGLALYTQVVLQGAFVVAKAADDPQVVHDAVVHLRRYFADLLSHGHDQKGATE